MLILPIYHIGRWNRIILFRFLSSAYSGQSPFHLSHYLILEDVSSQCSFTPLGWFKVWSGVVWQQWTAVTTIISGVARGHLVHVPSPVVVRVVFLRAVDLDLLLLAMTHYWNSGLHGLLHEYEWHAVIMIVQYRVQQNQFLVILVHLRCFDVICLTSFFVFNTVLCFLVCSLSVCLSTEEVSVTVLVFLVLYIFAYFLR